MTLFTASMPGIASHLPNLSEVTSQLSKVFHVAFGIFQSNDIASKFIESSLLPNIDRITETYSLVIAILSLVIGLIGCLFGYKLYRLFTTISGFFAGVFLGFFIGTNFFGHSNGIIILCCLVGGISLAIFSYHIYMAGIFVLCFFLGFVGAANYIQATGNVAFLMATICGLVVGALAIKFVKPVIIIATTFVCGSSAAEAMVALGRRFGVEFFTRSYAPIATLAAVFVISCLFQVVTTRHSEPWSKKKKRKKRKKENA